MRQLFVSFSILITLIFLASVFLINEHETRRLTGWRRAVLGLVAVFFGALLMHFAVQLPGGMKVGFISVIPVMAGLCEGPLRGLAVALPLIAYDSWAGGGSLLGMSGILLAGGIAGLLRLDPSAVYRPLRHLWWRGLVIFSIAATTMGLAPEYGPALLRQYYLWIVLLNTAALLVSGLVMAERFRMLRSLQEVTHLAHTDHLTGLPNLRSLEQAVQSHPAGGPACFLLLDLDHFKAINDSYGHPVGDEVLKTVAAIIQRQVRANDVVCRYGGEEFAILLRECSLPEAEQVAERIREAVAAYTLTLLQQGSVRLTVSGGLTALVPGAGLKSLFAAADKLLYCAKALGRNRIVTRSRPAAT